MAKNSKSSKATGASAFKDSKTGRIVLSPTKASTLGRAHIKSAVSSTYQQVKNDRKKSDCKTTGK